MMQVNIKQNKNVALLEIYKDENPVSQTNPLEVQDLKNFQLPEGLGGEIAIVSGFPQWAHCAVSSAVKNLYSVVASYDPKKQGGVVHHSVNPDYPLGSIIPLE